ncbi:MAG: hypothetical protein ABEK12_04030 [Candidatus Nanohaloarchaea archaeon]
MDIDVVAARTDDVMRYGLALVLLGAAGMKAVDPTPWAAYVPGWAAVIVPFTPTAMMHLATVLEATLGLALAVRYRTPAAAAVSAAWLASITVAVGTIGIWPIALRDLGLTVFAVSVALNEYRLTR